MRTLVVYESMFGMTRAVAEAVAEGLRTSSQAGVTDVVHAPARVPDDVDLLVVGGPTHAFSMSREQTRRDAIAQGAPVAPTGMGLREWLGRLPAGAHQRAATFDTRVEKVRHLPGSAARSAARALRRRGYDVVAPAASFYVHDVSGPLLEGELDRARAWGAELGRALASGPAVSTQGAADITADRRAKP